MSEPLFHPGDRVHWTNKQGVDLGVRTVLEVEERSGRPCYYLTPTDTPWFAVGEEDLAPSGEDSYQTFGTF